MDGSSAGEARKGGQDAERVSHASGRAEKVGLPNLPFLRTIRELAQQTGLSERALFHYARTGEFGYCVVDGTIMVDVREVEDWLRRAHCPARPVLRVIRRAERERPGAETPRASS